MKILLCSQVLSIALLMCFQSFASSQNSLDSALLNKAIKMLEKAEDEFENISGYEANIISTEWFNKKQNDTEYIYTKFKKSNNIYLKWMPGPYEGMQISHVPERDGKKRFKAKETGFLGIIGVASWDASNPIINSLYPHHFRPHEVSLKYVINISRYLLTKAQEKNKISVSKISEYKDISLNSIVDKVIVKLSDDPADGLRWSRIDLFFDRVTCMPLHFKLYDFDGDILGDYIFTEFKVNNNITDKEFELK